MKKILLSFAFFASLASANTINAIAVVVDKEPITTYDIDQTMKALKIWISLFHSKGKIIKVCKNSSLIYIKVE